MKKRIWSLLLCICLILSAWGITAFAAEKTITLTEDCNIEESITFELSQGDIIDDKYTYIFTLVNNTGETLTKDSTGGIGLPGRFSVTLKDTEINPGESTTITIKPQSSAEVYTGSSDVKYGFINEDGTSVCKIDINYSLTVAALDESSTIKIFRGGNEVTSEEFEKKGSQQYTYTAKVYDGSGSEYNEKDIDWYIDDQKLSNNKITPSYYEPGTHKLTATVSGTEISTEIEIIIIEVHNITLSNKILNSNISVNESVGSTNISCRDGEDITMIITPNDGYAFATAPTVKISDNNETVTSNNNGTYSCTIENVTQDYTLTVEGTAVSITPTISNQPISADYEKNETADALNITASADDGTLTYQWYRNAANANTGGTEISGANTASYIPPTTTSGTTYYYCVVTNTLDYRTTSKASDTAAVTINDIQIVDAATPEFTGEWSSEDYIDAYLTQQEATLRVPLMSESQLVDITYQWYSNTTRSNTGGTAIAGATASTHTIPLNTLGTFYFYCVVTNTDNSVNGQKTVSATSPVAAVKIWERFTIWADRTELVGGGTVTITATEDVYDKNFSCDKSSVEIYSVNYAVFDVTLPDTPGIYTFTAVGQVSMETATCTVTVLSDGENGSQTPGTYSATLNTSGLTGAKAYLEKTTDISSTDSVYLTIAAEGNNTFPSAPTVSVTGAIAGKVEKVPMGAGATHEELYSCELTNFTGNVTIIVRGKAVAPGSSSDNTGNSGNEDNSTNTGSQTGNDSSGSGENSGSSSGNGTGSSSGSNTSGNSGGSGNSSGSGGTGGAGGSGASTGSSGGNTSAPVVLKDSYENSQWTQDDAGTWYLIKADGTNATDWIVKDNQWYYLNEETGKMQTGWALVDNKWYLLADSGAMLTGWALSGNVWYYLNPTKGDMLTGWQLVGGKWYYLDPVNGGMMVGWQLIGGKYYYMTTSGEMLANTMTPDGYWVNESGEWVS